MSICLVSVVTSKFLPGALVMLHSFLRHNPWFEGDLLIFQNDLADSDIRKLHALYRKLQVLAVSSEMIEAAARVAVCRPEFQSQKSSFYKGECLKFSKYNHIILSDCDIVYTESIQCLLDKDLDLQACGDGSYYRDECRSLYDYGLLNDPAAPALESTFSAGFVVLSTRMLTDGIFDRYLGMMERYCEGGFPSRNTDQAVFNVLFNGKLSRLDCIYNYHLMHKKLLRDETGRTFSDAIVLHFGGASKPWDAVSTLRADTDDEELSAAFRVWRASYTDYLSDAAAKLNMDSNLK